MKNIILVTLLVGLSGSLYAGTGMKKDVICKYNKNHLSRDKSAKTKTTDKKVEAPKTPAAKEVKTQG